MATETRERILEASTELFRRQGYAGTGLKAVVAKAGAPFGSLYHHFPGGKDQLAAETIRRAGADYQAMVGELLLASPDPVTAVHDAFVEAGVRLRETDWADACPIETVALEVASTNDLLRRATAEVFDAWADAATAYFAASGIEETEARRLALTFLAVLEGAFVLDRTSRTTAALDAAAVSVSALVADALARIPPADGAVGAG
jgi:AcrR family transcriptional regulator